MINIGLVAKVEGSFYSVIEKKKGKYMEKIGMDLSILSWHKNMSLFWAG